MPFVYDIAYDESLIKVTVSGTPDYLSTDRLWHDIAAACLKHECFAIPGQSDTDDCSAAEAVVRNRGLQIGRSFDTVAEARRWLAE